MFNADEVIRTAGLRPGSPNKKLDIEFVYEAPEAREVYLAGSFNNWDRTSLPMKKNKRGQWKATVKLAPGKYPYKFVADGDWTVGKYCPEVTVEPSGIVNCTLTVEPEIAA